MRLSPLRSVRSKLVALSLALIVVPGAVFALMAARDATVALERAVGRQLATVAGHAAQELAGLVDGHSVRLAGWAGQELMREVLVADIDKRISRFLLGERARTPMLLDAIVTDVSGTVVAATDPAMLGTVSRSELVRGIASGGGGCGGPEIVGGGKRREAAIAPGGGQGGVAIADADVGAASDRNRGVVVAGPHASARHGVAVLEFAAPIYDPEDVSSRIGVLHAIYDWRMSAAALAKIRQDVAATGMAIELLVLDADGRLIGGSWAPGAGLDPGDDLRAAGWRSAGDDAPAYGVEERADALVGRAALAAPAPRWSVLAVEPRASALAAVRAMNRRLVAALALVVLAGLAVATLLAHRMARPLRALTRATGELARAGGALTAIPVRSQDEIGELTAAFNRMAAELRRAHEDLVATARLASLGEIAAGIAHEVRTPLGILRGSAQILGRSLPNPDERQRELVETIVGEVDRLERVVSGLTELAKPRPPSVEPTALEPLLERAGEFVAGQARESSVAIRVERLGSPCAARCDPEQIYQVILNLLMNALQAQPHGGEIRVRALGAANGRVGFEVSDDGPGIAAEAQAHIFAPFYTQREGGTGLGLAMVERIVRAHDGAVSVTSAPGQGATFRVELPAAGAAA